MDQRVKYIKLAVSESKDVKRLLLVSVETANLFTMYLLLMLVSLHHSVQHPLSPGARTCACRVGGFGFNP